MKTLTSTVLLLLMTGAAVAGGVNPPVYPGATAAARPAALGLKAPASSKSYATSDEYAKVEAWYKAHLNGAMEVHQPGMETSQATFLVGNASNGKIVYIRRYNGKTWVVIGPPA